MANNQNNTQTNNSAAAGTYSQNSQNFFDPSQPTNTDPRVNVYNNASGQNLPVQSANQNSQHSNQNPNPQYNAYNSQNGSVASQNQYNNQYNSQPINPANQNTAGPQNINYANPQMPAASGLQSAPNYPVSNINQSPNSGNFVADSGFQVPGQQPPADTNNKQKPQAKPNQFWIKTKIVLKKWWWAFLAGFLLLCILIAYLILSFQPEPEIDKSPYDMVTASLSADSTSASGSPMKFTIEIANQENVAIEDIVIDLDFDANFTYLDTITNIDPSKADGSQYQIGKLNAVGNAGNSINIQFEGVIVANIDDTATFEGVVSYTPSSIKDQEENIRSVSIEPISIRVTEPEVELDIFPSESTVQNQGEAEINVSFENISDRDIRDVRLRVEYPSGSSFGYAESELILDNNPISSPDNGNNEWLISTLSQNQRQTLTIRGNVIGQDQASLVFQAFIEARQSDGSYLILTRKSTPIKIATQPLEVVTTIVGKEESKLFGPGDTLSFNVAYRNKSTATLRDLELVASIDDPADILDYTTLQFVGGVRGSLNNRSVTWRGVNTPLLASLSPQASGTLQFTIKAKDEGSFYLSNLNQSSYLISPRIQVEGSNLQAVTFTGSNYKAEGDLLFEQNIEEIESETLSSNQKIFKVSWTLETKQNQVNQVSITTKSDLPESSWDSETLNITPSTELDNFSYDPETGIIEWKPGDISAYLGINNNQPITISFEIFVEVSPGSSLSNILVFSAPEVVGTDDYTGVVYEIVGEEFKT